MEQRVIDRELIENVQSAKAHSPGSVFKAYIYMFKCNNFILQFMIISLLNIPLSYVFFLLIGQKASFESPDFCFLIVFSIITSLISLGYSTRCTQNILFLGEDNPKVLPKFGGFVTSYFFLGLKKTCYLLMANLMMIPSLFFSYKRMGVTDGSIRLYLDGMFSIDFDYLRCPDFNLMLDLIIARLWMFLKLSFISSSVLVLTVIVGLVLYFVKGVKLPDIMAFIPFILSYHTLVSAYCAGISAQYTKSKIY